MSERQAVEVVGSFNGKDVTFRFVDTNGGRTILIHAVFGGPAPEEWRRNLLRAQVAHRGASRLFDISANGSIFEANLRIFEGPLTPGSRRFDEIRSRLKEICPGLEVYGGLAKSIETEICLDGADERPAA